MPPEPAATNQILALLVTLLSAIAGPLFRVIRESLNHRWKVEESEPQPRKQHGYILRNRQTAAAIAAAAWQRSKLI